MKLRFLSCASVFALLASHAYAINVTVDFTKTVQSVDPRAISIDIGEYNATPGSSDFQALTALGVDAMRIDLQNGNNSAPALGAGGTNGAGDPWVQAIDQAGAMPVIRLHVDGENDNGPNSGGTATDAQNMVKHYTAGYKSVGLSRPVQYYIVGNENNADDTSDQGAHFIAYAPGMRTAAGGTRLYIGGPAVAWYDRNGLDNYINNTHGKGVTPDIIDYHQYGQAPSDGTNLNRELDGGGGGGDVQQYGTVSYEAEIRQLQEDFRGKFGSLPAGGVECGEWGVNNTGADGSYGPVWHASVLGHIIKAGGISMTYNDGNLINKSPYYGILMFTGGQHKQTVTKPSFGPLFSHFGTNVVYTYADGDNTNANVQGQTVTTNNTIEVYASSNPTNIVVINKTGGNQTLTFKLTGVLGSADQWETTGGMPVKQNGPIPVTNGTFTATVHGYGVDTFVLPAGANSGISGGGTGGGTPTITVKDGVGNTWTLVGGEVYENGAPAGYTSQVTNLVNSGGVIYQQNSAGLWWKWGNGAWAATGAPAAGSTGGGNGGSTTGASSSCAMGTSVTDGSGNTWTIVNGVIEEDGSTQKAGFSLGVTELVYTGGKVYQRNSSNNWYVSTGNGGWQGTTAPDTTNCSTGNVSNAGQGSTSGGVSATCKAGQTLGSPLTDSSGRVWTIVASPASSDLGNVAAVAGSTQAAGFSMNVCQLALGANGEVCQENTSNNWYCWVNGSWTASTAP